MTLGLTDGTRQLGLEGYTINVYFLTTNTGLYGKGLGAVNNNGLRSVGGGIGITKDSTKSGLITKFAGLTLGTVPSEKLGSFYIRY